MDINALWGRIVWLGKELRAQEMPAANVGLEATVALHALARISPKQLDDCKAQIARLLGIDNLDQWIESIVGDDKLPSLIQYQIAQGYSSACIFGDDFATALRIWSYALTASREPEAHLEAIDAATAVAYDQAPLHQQACRNFMGFLRARLAHRNNFLDLCCGTGLTTEYLGLDNKRISGVDLELGGLHASGRAPLFADLYQGDAKAILPSLPAASFEVIWCCGALYFFADPRWIFLESSRLLRHDGLLCLNAWASPESREVGITKAGSYRYCHSQGYLERCARMAGMRLLDQQWSVTYNMPTWYLLFEKDETAQEAAFAAGS